MRLLSPTGVRDGHKMDHHRDTEAQSSRLNDSRHRIIGCAIEVHRVLGPGLLEPMYEARCASSSTTRLRYARQVTIPAYYKGRPLGDYRRRLHRRRSRRRRDQERRAIDAVFEAQLLTYLRSPKKRVGLLINFNSRLLKDGIKQKFALRHASHDAAKRRDGQKDRPRNANARHDRCLCFSRSF